MMAKQMTNKQVLQHLIQLHLNVVHKNQKRVPGCQEELRSHTFEIEPWRNMKPIPESQIKSYDEIKANPFTLPLKMKHMKPYLDHSTWVKPKPRPPTTCCQDQQDPGQGLKHI